MNLRQYLFTYNITHKDFSKKVDCTSTHISNYLSGRHRLSKWLAKSISEETKGKCTIEELLDWTGYQPPEQ